MRIVLLVAGLALAGALVACGGGPSSTPVPSDIPTATLTMRPTDARTGVSTLAPTADATANARRTGIPEVDAAIDAVLSGDAEELRRVTAFQLMACTATPVGIGPFYCDDGEPDGAVSEVLPAAQCEGSYVRKEKLTLADPTLTLYAASRTEGGYSIVFSRIVGPAHLDWGLTVTLEGGRISQVDFGCGETPQELVANTAPPDFILPPQ